MKINLNFNILLGLMKWVRDRWRDQPRRGACLISVLGIKKLLAEGFFNGIRDSKKLSEKKREERLEKIKELKTKGDLDYRVSFASNKIIDKKGISHCLRLAIKNSLKKLSRSSQLFKYSPVFSVSVSKIHWNLALSDSRRVARKPWRLQLKLEFKAVWLTLSGGWYINK